MALPGLVEVACHEQNYGIIGVLKGARARAAEYQTAQENRVTIEGGQKAMKTTIGLVLKVIGGFSLLVSLPALAHHSFAAAYDENSPINKEGVVTKVELTNPHSWLWVDVTNEDGTVTNWGFEGGPPVNLFRKGVTKDALPEGSEIKVFAYQAKSGENKGVAVFFEYLDGRKIFMGGSAPGADGNPRPNTR